MKIGLVRHFKVTRGYPKQLWITSADLTKWVSEYDESDVEEIPVDLGSVTWKSCYSSTLPRARTTAATIYQGKIKETEKLREIDLVPANRECVLVQPISMGDIEQSAIANPGSSNDVRNAVRQPGTLGK